MSGFYWRQVLERGLEVPTDRPLDELTAELTRMLGSPDPVERDRTAYPALGTWIDRGVYDELLPGLGDGMAAGLENGLGDNGLCKNGDCVAHWSGDGSFVCSDAPVRESQGGDNLTCGP